MTVTHRLEVVDADALQEAVAAAVGAPRDDLEARMRAIPANLVGVGLSRPPSLPDMPGVQRRGTAVSIAEYEPDNL